MDRGSFRERKGKGSLCFLLLEPPIELFDLILAESLTHFVQSDDMRKVIPGVAARLQRLLDLVLEPIQLHHLILAEPKAAGEGQERD